MSDCICTQDCPLTEDKHYINCPEHSHYDPAFFRAPTIPDHGMEGDAGRALRICKNLRSVADASQRDNGKDIPLGEMCRKAADAIESHASRADRAEAALREAREALSFYADNHEWPNEGPWGVDSNDYGDVARAALGKMGGA